MSQTITMKYGDYSFTPVPFMSISKEYNRSDDGTKLGATVSLTLNGTLTPVPSGATGLDEVDSYQETLREAFSQDGMLLEAKCDSTSVFACHPIVRSIEFSPSRNNWVETMPFVINLEYNDESAGVSSLQEDNQTPYVKSASESWEVEFLDMPAGNTWGVLNDVLPYTIRVGHSVSAVGKPNYTISSTTSGVETKRPWEYAKNYVEPLLGFDSERVVDSGILNFNRTLLGEFNHVRVSNIDEFGGGYSVNESWLVLNTGSMSGTNVALEDFSAEVRTGQEDGLTKVTLNGTIQGLEDRTYGSESGNFSITKTKFANASGYFNEVAGTFFGRAQEVGEEEASNSINPLVLETSVGYSPAQGSVNYSYTYDDRPCNFIDSAIHESITITDSHPTDRIAQLIILGRATGPIIQSLGTVGPATREVTIEAQIAPPTGCETGVLASNILAIAPTGDVTTLLCGFQGELTGTWDQVFKQRDQSSWNPKTGRYSRSVTWIYTNCSGNAPSTSFC